VGATDTPLIWLDKYQVSRQFHSGTLDFPNQVKVARGPGAVIYRFMDAAEIVNINDSCLVSTCRPSSRSSDISQCFPLLISPAFWFGMPPSAAVLYKRSHRPVRMETLNSNSRPSVKDVAVDAQLRDELTHESPRAASPEVLRMNSMNSWLAGTLTSVCGGLFSHPCNRRKLWRPHCQAIVCPPIRSPKAG
jgi:hypothetical protein